MAKLKFGAWIPTYAWADRSGGAKNVRNIRASIEKCEKHGIDVWVIDHLLSAPGLYGNAWLEPLSTLAYAAAVTAKVKIATGIMVLPVRHPVVLAKEISTLCHLSNNRTVIGEGTGEHARRLGNDPRALKFGHCNFIHLVEEKSHDRAVDKSKAPFLRAMGQHRSWEHLQECYMIGSIDRINARIQDLVDAGLKYIVLGPVTDDPRQIDLLARRVMGAFK